MNSVNEDEKMKWETLSSEYLFRRPWLTARRDVVRLPNGTVYDEYYVLEYPMWINVIAITPEGKFVMGEAIPSRTRHRGDGALRGVWPRRGEDPLTTAQRELLEETGFGGGEWELSMVISANPSSQNNLSYSFIARDVERIAEQHLDETEDIRVELLSEDEVWDMLVNDNMKQALMAAPLWKYFALKGRQK